MLGALLVVAWPSFVLACSARDFPPDAFPPKPLVLPAPALRVLPNGLKVVAIERHSLPILTLRLVVKSGAESDPAEAAWNSATSERLADGGNFDPQRQPDLRGH